MSIKGVHSALIGDELLIVVNGAFVGSTAPELYRIVDAALALRRVRCVIDLGRTTVVDEGGCSALAATAHRMAALAVPLLLILPGNSRHEVADAAAVRALFEAA
jgi:anti-anti-sigma regulatory factor